MVINGHTIRLFPRNQKLELQTKYILLCGSTAKVVSFEWLHPGISFMDSKVLTLEAPISTYKFSKLISIHFLKE